MVAEVGVGRRCDPCRKSMKFFGVRKAFIPTGGSGYMNLYVLKSIELHTKKKKKVTILYNHLKYKISKILI